MKRRCAAAAAAGCSVLALLAGCRPAKPDGTDHNASSRASDTKVKQDFLRGVDQIRSSKREHLRDQLVRTISTLRRDRGSTGAGRRGRSLALQGFTTALKGVKAEIDFYVNDSGKLEAATKDAVRADRYAKQAANLLRAAGRAFGVHVGKLNGR